MFVPQELGASRSGYSLRDQLKVNPDFGDPQSSGKSGKQTGKLPNTTSTTKTAVTFDDVEKFIKKIRSEWGIASICDIVLNHTANESPWIQEHPEATYSCLTMPHLRPAFLLDAVLGKVTTDTATGSLESVGVPRIVENDDHIQALRHQIHTVYLPKIKLYEFYQCDAEKYFQRFSAEVIIQILVMIFHGIIINFFGRCERANNRRPRARMAFPTLS